MASPRIWRNIVSTERGHLCLNLEPVRNVSGFGIPVLALPRAVGIITWKWQSPSHTLKDDDHVGVVKRIDLVQDVTVSGTLIPNKKTIFNPPLCRVCSKKFT